MEELPEGKGLQMANWPNSPYLYRNVLHNSSRNGDGGDLHFFFMNSCFSANFHSVPDCLSPWLPHLVPLHITCSPASACLSAGGSRLVIIFPQGYPLAVDHFLWQMQGTRSCQRALLGAPMAQIPCSHLPSGRGTRPDGTGQPCELPGAPRHPSVPRLGICLGTWMTLFVVHCLCYGRLYLRPTSLKNPQAELTNKLAQWSLDTSLMRSWVLQKDCTTASHLLCVFSWITSFILQKLQCHLVRRERSLLFSWCYLLVYLQAARKNLAAWDTGAAYTACLHARVLWISKVCKLFGCVMC